MNLFEISHIGTEKVDRERGIIPGVKILGRISKNGREYSDKALREAAAKYEGVDVNVNHPDRSKPGAERRIEDGIGWLESVQVRADGVYGDLHYLKEHPSSALVAEAAERRSNRFGLSHNAVGGTVKRGGKTVVESIERVISVDLVQNPATNAGLFESTEIRTIRETLEEHAPDMLAGLIELLEDGALLPPEAMDEPMAPLNDPAADGRQAVKAACAQILTAMLDLPGDLKALAAQGMEFLQKVISGLPDPAAQGDGEEPAFDENGDPGADPANRSGEGDQDTDPTNPTSNDPAADPTADDDSSADADPANPFAKRKKPMAESVALSTDQKLELLNENKQLKERLTLLEQKIEATEIREHCTKMLQEHRREITGPRLTAMARMDDDEARILLIEEWPVIREDAPTAQARPKPTFSMPLREAQENLKYPSDLGSFVSSMR